MPPVEVITRDQYRARLESEAAESADAEGPEPAREVALQLLGLVAQTTSVGEARIDDSVASYRAFYRWSSRTITIIDDDDQRDAFTTFLETYVLLHEFVHAAQHRELAFEQFSGTTDAWFSRGAAIEGEARLYDHLAIFEMWGNPPDAADLHYLARGVEARQLRIASSPSPFFAVGSLVYPLGARRFIDAWAAQGNTGVRRLYGDRPAGALGWMLEGEQPPPSVPPIECAWAPPQSEGWSWEVRDRFGAAHAYGLQVADLQPPETEDEASDERIAATKEHIAAAWNTALAWTDDRVWVGRHDEHGVAVEWRIRFRTRAAARSAAATLTARPLRSVEVIGNDLIVRGAEDAGVLADWTGGTCSR